MLMGSPPPPSDYTMEDYKAIFFGGTRVKTTLIKYLVYLIKTPQSGTLVSWGFFL